MNDLDRIRTPLPMFADRQCGACQVCCELPYIVQLDKPRYTKCDHQCAAGCGVYSERPQECQDFYCGWRHGLLPKENARPDACGMLFVPDMFPLPSGDMAQGLSVQEIKPNVFERERSGKLVQQALLVLQPHMLHLVACQGYAAVQFTVNDRLNWWQMVRRLRQQNEGGNLEAAVLRETILEQPVNVARGIAQTREQMQAIRKKFPTVPS